MVWSKHHYQFDAQGNTRALLDASTDTVTDTFTYDAWGNEVEHTGTSQENLTWNGRAGYYRDRDTDSYQVRKRPYAPKLGRWKTVDPIWPLDEINQFSLVRNNPMNRTDPSGMASLLIDPVSPESMKWYDYNLGLIVGQSHTELSLECRCICRRGKIFHRRIKYHIKCVIKAQFFLLINTEIITNYLTDPKYAELVENDQKNDIPPPTLFGTYGHEQRHVQSESALLRKLAARVTFEENSLSHRLKSLTLCKRRASSLQIKYLREYVKIVLGESEVMQILSQKGENYTPLQNHLLAHPDLPAAAMVRLGDQSYIPIIKERLQDSDSYQRSWLEACLCALGDKPSRTVKASASQPLTDTMQDFHKARFNIQITGNTVRSAIGHGFTRTLITGTLITPDGNPVVEPHFHYVNNRGDEGDKALQVSYDKQTGLFHYFTLLRANYSLGTYPHNIEKKDVVVRASGMKPLRLTLSDGMPHIVVTLDPETSSK